MKAAAFACLLLIANVSSFPQDVKPSQSRVVDIWLQNALEELRDRIYLRGLDPLEVEEYSEEHRIIDDLIHSKITAKDVRCVGLRGIFWNYLNWNLLFGRLDFDLVMPRVSCSVGNYVAEGRFGDSGGRAEFSGSFVISNVRLAGNCLMRLDWPGPYVTLYNIDVTPSARVEADIEDANWKCRNCEQARELTEEVNNFLNVVINDLINTYQREIGTIIGNGIQQIVNRWW